MKKFNTIIRRLALATLLLFTGNSMFAQNIELNPSTKSTNISESSFKGFQSTFSFNKIETMKMKTEAGDFSALSISKTINAGEIGAPSLPIARELVAVPFGATPVVKVVSFTTTDYELSDYGIERVYPQQPSYSKSAKTEDMIFHYNEKAYQTRSLGTAPEVVFEVLGTMRGIQIGALQVEPVSYNPANNTIRVYNDIQLEVIFENADYALTEQRLVESYSPYFDVVYKQLFNSRAIEDVYDEHPDLYSVPVKMLVITNRMFEDALKPWLEWKTQKGFYVDARYTDEIGTTSNELKEYIKEQYEINKYTFVIIAGDKNQVAPSLSLGEETSRVTDLYYSSIDGDYFPDMYHSRMACETVAEMEALVEKTLQYEQYTMPDPSYLNSVLMIAGHDDSGWTTKVGRPTIQYATNYYYNAEHGYSNVHEYLGPNYSGCYSHLDEGVAFANYTAHGGETSWSDPAFYVSDVYNLKNTNKYFWAMGNCCLAADWGYGSTSFGEAMIRADKKGAWGYIGSCPVTYWWEDYYFGVGATTVYNRMPTYEETTMGNYDALWLENSYNVLSAVPFVGNLAVCYGHAANYPAAVNNQYYFEAYHTLGDGSVMPYRAVPESNNVSHLSTIPIGTDYYTITAAPGSYVGISKNGVLHGAGMIGESGTTDINIEPIVSNGDVTIVITHPAFIPYIETVPAVAVDGPYLSITNCETTEIPINQETNLTVEISNVGVEATTSDATITLSCDQDFVTITDAEATIGVINVDTTTTLENAFAIKVDEGVANNTKFTIQFTITCNGETWENKVNFSVIAPKINFEDFVFSGGYIPGESQTVAAKFSNKGAFIATNAVVKATSTNEYITIENDTFEIGSIDPNGTGMALFNIAIDEACSVAESIEINFEFTADNGITATGTGYLRNSCLVEFILKDTYGDGWDNSTLDLEFDDGTPPVSLIMDGGSIKSYELEIGANTKVTVSFNAQSWFDDECRYTIQYKDGDIIYETTSAPNDGYNTEFIVNCSGGGGNGTFNPAQNLTAEVNMNQVTLTWNAPRALSHYIVERNGIQIAETNETTYVDSELTSGVYTYAVTAVYDEGQAMPATVIAEVGVDVEENGDVMFSVYPNPAKDVININTNAVRYEYQLINSVGQVIISGESNGEHQINISNVNKGIYFLKVVADGQAKINKLIIQ